MTMDSERKYIGIAIIVTCQHAFLDQAGSISVNAVTSRSRWKWDLSYRVSWLLTDVTYILDLGGSGGRG